MTASLALLLLSAALQSSPVEVTVASIPPNERVTVPLAPNGEAELRREPTLTRVEVDIDRIEPLAALRSDMRAWVVWAVSPEGDVENLGELEPDGRGARLETVSSFTRLGIIVTAEPHFRVLSPSSWVGFRSGPGRSNESRYDAVRVEVGRVDYSGTTLPPQGSIHPRVSQARMAVALAEDAGAAGNVSPTLRQARIALDSVEQLLRSQTPLDVTLAYANDAIRLAELAEREARRAAETNRVTALDQRVADLEDSLRLARADRDRADAAQRDAGGRVNGLLSELASERDANRLLTLERDSAERDLSNAEQEVRDLSDPWPRLVSALLYNFGARQTPRGLVLTLQREAFSGQNLTADTREWLARLGGMLSFEAVPEVWVEGHSRTEGGLAESRERALHVRDYLVAAGLPDSSLFSQGLGARTPIPGTENDDALNERVEIVIREPGAL